MKRKNPVDLRNCMVAVEVAVEVAVCVLLTD